MAEQQDTGKLRVLDRRIAWVRRFRFTLLMVLAVGFLVTTSGCTRRFFRKRSDLQVSELLAEKSHPLWNDPQYHVYPDPRARFADPTNPDRPPMPPDDPAARDFSPTPQRPGHAGCAYIEGDGYLKLLTIWDAENRRKLEEEQARKEPKVDFMTSQIGPNTAATALLGAGSATVEGAIERELTAPVTTTSMLPTSDAKPLKQRPFLISLEQAVELALINSREYQTRREELYLAALPVTIERFAFAPQFLAGEQVFRQRFGQNAPNGPQNNWLLNSQFGFSRLFSTGALLLFSFANQTVFNLGSTTTSVSTINFDIMQPFLQGGGRAVTLEPLTQVERNLLYEARDYARFRQEFFVYVAAGQPAFIPGVQAGVQALSPGTVTQPPAFFPVVTHLATPLGTTSPLVQIPPGSSNIAAPVFSPNANPQGYLTTLGQKANLRVNYMNIIALQGFLERFQHFLDGGIVQPVQAGQIEQRLLANREMVLLAQASYRASLDQFKLQLGLPTSLPLDVDDGPLQPMYDIAERFERLSFEYRKTVDQVQNAGSLTEAEQLRARIRKLINSSPLMKGTQFRDRLLQRWDAWQKVPTIRVLDRHLDGLRQERRKLNDRKTELERKNEQLPERDQSMLAATDFEIQLGDFEKQLRGYETLAAEKPQPEKKEEMARWELAMVNLFQRVLRNLLPILGDAYQERLEKVRQSWPALPSACLNGMDMLKDHEDEVLDLVHRVALENRYDLMNARGQLVDAWRKVRVAANALLGVFNVEYFMSTSTPAGRADPFAFGGSRTQNQLIFNGQLPLVRVIQRANYRSTLIFYQQQRRQLMLAQDSVLFAVRLQLRQLRATANDYQTVQKRQLEIAYNLVDQALQAFNQPPIPPGPAAVPGLVGPPAIGGSGQQGDPAALTQQLLNTQNSLVAALTDIYNVWVTYLTTRYALYRDLGTMQLDPRGVWIDDAPTSCDITSGCSGQSSQTGQQLPRSSDSRGERREGQPEQLPAPRPVPAAPSARLEPSS